MKLAIIIGSTRQGRQTPKEAKWILNRAKTIDGISAQIIDLVDYPLPFFNEAISPRYNPNRQLSGEVKKWSDAIRDFDAYVFVTPEYNHSVGGELKNAIDYLTDELSHKPSAIASHGSVGGARAAMHLREILAESRSVVIPNGVAIIGLSDNVDVDGNLSEALLANPYGPQAALDTMLSELKWYSDALSEARK